MFANILISELEAILFFISNMKSHLHRLMDIISPYGVYICLLMSTFALHITSYFLSNN